MAAQQVWPSIAVEIGHRSATIFAAAAERATHTGLYGHIFEGICSGDMWKEKKECQEEVKDTIRFEVVEVTHGRDLVGQR